MSGNIIKNSIVHFKQLRSLELLDAFFLKLYRSCSTRGGMAMIFESLANKKAHMYHFVDCCIKSAFQPVYRAVPPADFKLQTLWRISPHLGI